MKPYLVEPIEAFQNSDRTNIAILRTGNAADQTLYDDLAAECEKLGTVQIVNEVFLNSYAAMGTGLVDILIVPELELLLKKLYYPLKKYIDGGGAVIIASDDFFMTGKILEDEFSQFDVDAIGGDAYYRATSASLGIKPYVSDITPAAAFADPMWIPGPGLVKTPLPRAGVQMNVGSDRQSPLPPDGHVFIERYEVLRNYDAVTGCDAYGRKVNSVVNFAQNWENGARYVIYSNNLEHSVIRKENPLFAETLKAAVRFCENKVFAVSCFPDYACYRQEEAVSVVYRVKNSGKEEAQVEVKLEICDHDGNTVSEETGTVLIPPETLLEQSAAWNPDRFACDSYSVFLTVSRNGQVLSRADNGFVVWDEEVIRRGPEVGIAGKYFDINGKASMITGTNYYESNIGEVMWVKPNIRKLEADFAQMSADGINFIRIHYHHVKWFKDYLRTCTGQIFAYYEDLEDDCLPGERILRIFDAHIYLCQKYGIIYGGDLFTLVPEEMGDPKGWYGVQDYLWFEDKIRAQKEFLRLLIPRYTKVPGIAWDLYNEPCCIPCEPHLPRFHEEFYRWSSDMKQFMRSLGDRHLITVGGEFPARFGDVVDFYAEHVNYKFIRERKAPTELPEIIQECWLDRPATPLGDELQQNDVRQAITDILELGFAGFVPWQWTNQQRLWCDSRTFVGEIWDDRLGTCVRNDGTLKPGGRFYRDFVRIIDGLDFLGCADGTVATSRGKLCVEYTDDGDRRIRYYEDGAVLREIARKTVSGKTLAASADHEGNLFYLCDAPDTDYLKADRAGVLTVDAKRVPAKISVCEKPGGEVLAELDPAGLTNFRLTVRESDINYWFRLSY